MNEKEKLMLRDLYSSANADQRLILEELYPELAESEDGRIRKEIKSFLKISIERNSLPIALYESWIAWLEQQNENKSIIDVPSKEVILAIWALGNEWKEITNGRNSTEHGTQLNYIQKHWHESDYYLKEKQGEQTSLQTNEHAWLYLVADVLTWKDGIGQYLDDPRVQELAKKLCNEYAQQLYNSSVISNSSNIGNNKQEPDDKVEPKFKVGDWYIDDKDGSIFQIVAVLNNSCKCKTNKGEEYYYPHYLLENDCHLWTIEDAKPYDILATKSGRPFIFKDFSDVKHPNNPTAYCGINTLDNFIIGSGKYWWTDEKVYPATKEQCNLLFQKIKESGYKWLNNQLEKIDNEDYVDLGLPSGTLWTKCNFGAEKETDFGYFFQWGDTQGYSGVDEHQFNWNEYKYGSWDDLTKYNGKDTKLILDNEDDPVFASTNGMFKIPTKDQLQELIDNTNHEWTTIDDVNGMKFINKNDNTKYIFIPAAGDCNDGSHYGVGSWGNVWSASRDESSAYYAWSMYFSAGSVGMDYYNRCYGFSVRGVLNK